MYSKHMAILNKRIREVEEELFANVLKIACHLKKSIENGMEEYRTFYIEGLLMIQTEIDNVPKDVLQRLSKMGKHIVATYSDGQDEDVYREIWQHTRHFDYMYFAHPEEYPRDYSRKTRTYELFILKSILEKKVRDSDLMHVQPENIISQIVISI